MPLAVGQWSLCRHLRVCLGLLSCFSLGPLWGILVGEGTHWVTEGCSIVGKKLKARHSTMEQGASLSLKHHPLLWYMAHAEGDVSVAMATETTHQGSTTLHLWQEEPPTLLRESHMGWEERCPVLESWSEDQRGQRY